MYSILGFTFEKYVQVMLAYSSEYSFCLCYLCDDTQSSLTYLLYVNHLIYHTINTNERQSRHSFGKALIQRFLCLDFFNICVIIII